MTEECIFIDSSVFLAFFIDGKDVFSKLFGFELCTSTNVLEEIAYVLIRGKAKRKTNIKDHAKLLRYLRENTKIVIELAEEILSDILVLIDELSIKTLNPAEYHEMFEIIKTYGLLPNDALIAATCKANGIKKIATFDDDFKRVDFLEVVEI